MTRSMTISAGVVILWGAWVSAGFATSHDIASYIERRKACNHWLGEEGYDAARRAEINRHIRSLRCLVLDKQEKVLLHRYRHHPDITERIRAAHDALL